jgi:hypothetical protein
VGAIYIEVPMSVNVTGIAHRLFQATMGLKQGCPLSPVLLDLYIADFERCWLAAAGSSSFDLPELVPGSPVPPLVSLTFAPSSALQLAACKLSWCSWRRMA